MTTTANHIRITFNVSRKFVEKAKLDVSRFNQKQKIRNEAAQAISPSIQFEMDGENNQFSFHGDRTAFHKSGGLEFVCEFFNGVLNASQWVCDYQSNERLLKWNETELSYYNTRAPVGESIKYFKSKGKDPVKHMEKRIPAGVLQMIGRDYRQVQAALTKEELVMWHALSKVEEKATA